MVAPPHWILIKSWIRPTLSNRNYIETVMEYRSLVELPDDLDWVDKRPFPIYPLVISSKEISDAYNGELGLKYVSLKQQ